MNALIEPAPVSASLDTRPELMSSNEFSTFTKINYDDNDNDYMISNTTVNSNSFMNMNLNEIFNKIINILPFMYNDFYEKKLEIKLKYKNKNISESDILKETLINFIFKNENIIYLGILQLIITFFLYIIS